MTLLSPKKELRSALRPYPPAPSRLCLLVGTRLPSRQRLPLRRDAAAARVPARRLRTRSASAQAVASVLRSVPPSAPPAPSRRRRHGGRAAARHSNPGGKRRRGGRERAAGGGESWAGSARPALAHALPACRPTTARRACAVAAAGRVCHFAGRRGRSGVRRCWRSAPVPAACPRPSRRRPPTDRPLLPGAVLLRGPVRAGGAALLGHGGCVALLFGRLGAGASVAPAAALPACLTVRLPLRSLCVRTTAV